MTDSQLRRIEDQLLRADSSLASSLAPFLLPVIKDRSCAELAPGKVTALKATLEELERLLSAAVRVDASRRPRSNTPPHVAELLAGIHPDPPYSDQATTLVHAIRAAFASSSSR